MVQLSSISGAANSRPLMNWLDTSPGIRKVPGCNRPNTVMPLRSCSKRRPCWWNSIR